MIIVDDIEQGTPEWHNLRLGIPTASEFKRIITSKGDPSKQAEGYLNELVAERITGISTDHYVSYDMKRGTENEPIARSLFELMYGVEVREVAFCYFDDRKRYGCSPDGLPETMDPFGIISLYTAEGLEIKDAKPSKQIERLRDGWKWKSDHYAQVQGCLLVTGCNIWHLMSHCIGLEPIVIKVERDERFIATLKVGLEDFCDELDRIEEERR